MHRSSRRQFMGHLVGVVVVTGSSITIVGCTPQNVFQELDTWVPVAVTTFDGIVALVDSVLTAVQAGVDAAWAALQVAINAYTHTPDPTSTLLDRVIATLDAVETALGNLPTLPSGIPQNILTGARLGLALLIATLKDIQARINPTPTPAQASIRAASARMAAALPSVTPAKSTKDFVSQINKIMSDNGLALRVK